MQGSTLITNKQLSALERIYSSVNKFRNMEIISLHCVRSVKNYAGPKTHILNAHKKCIGL